MFDLTICVDEKHRSEVTLGFYSHDNPRKQLPPNVRQALLNDLRNKKGPKIGTPFLFTKRGGGSYYAARITSYGIDWQLQLAIDEKRVWVLNDKRK